MLITIRCLNSIRTKSSDDDFVKSVPLVILRCLTESSLIINLLPSFMVGDILLLQILCANSFN